RSSTGRLVTMGMMGRRLFATASAISLLAAVLVAVLWVWSYSDQAENGSLYGGLVVWNPVRVRAFGGATYIYNQNVPYTGSIIGILSANGTRPRWPQVAGFDGGGVYYRYITSPGELPGGTCWTLAFPLFYP